MNEEDFEYDPERALWKPGRRTFILMLGTAAIGTLVTPVTNISVAVPGVYKGSWEKVRLLYTRLESNPYLPHFVLEDSLVREQGLGEDYVSIIDKKQPAKELQFKTNSQHRLVVTPSSSKKTTPLEVREYVP
jgi:hypothetical protein